MDRLYQGFHPDLQFEAIPNGMENILNAMNTKRGLIMLSGHLGGWDLAAALLGSHGFTDQMNVAEFRADGFSFNNLKDKMDPAYVRSVNTGGSEPIFEIHQALSKGKCLGLMGDRPIGDRFELIPFLGKLAPFDVTAFRLAAATKVPLLFTFGFKGSGDRYDFYAKPPREYIYDPKLPREIQTFVWATGYVKEIETFVKTYPEQWFNFYPFWSALPKPPNGAKESSSVNQLLEELPMPVVPASKVGRELPKQNPATDQSPAL